MHTAYGTSIPQGQWDINTSCRIPEPPALSVCDMYCTLETPTFRIHGIQASIVILTMKQVNVIYQDSDNHSLKHVIQFCQSFLEPQKILFIL